MQTKMANDICTCASNPTCSHNRPHKGKGLPKCSGQKYWAPPRLFSFCHSQPLIHQQNMQRYLQSTPGHNPGRGHPTATALVPATTPLTWTCVSCCPGPYSLISKRSHIIKTQKTSVGEERSQNPGALLAGKQTGQWLGQTVGRSLVVKRSPCGPAITVHLHKKTESRDLAKYQQHTHSSSIHDSPKVVAVQISVHRLM